MKFDRALVSLCVLASVFATASARAELYGGAPPKGMDWLQPGWGGILETGKDPGMSITFFMEKDGLVVCGSTGNPSNEVIPAALHCNQRGTNIGLHVPAFWLFKGESRIVRYGKLALVTAPLALSQFTIGNAAIATPIAATVASVLPTDPQAMFLAQHSMKKSFYTLGFFSADTDEKASVVIPAAPVPYHYADMLGAIIDRAVKFQNHCTSIVTEREEKENEAKAKGKTLKSLEGDEKANFDYCKRQGANLARSDALMTACNIPKVTAQAGEPGQAELWRLGQYLPAGCEDALRKYKFTKVLMVPGNDRHPKPHRSTVVIPNGGEDLIEFAHEAIVDEYLAANVDMDKDLEDYLAANRGTGTFGGPDEGKDVAKAEKQARYEWVTKVNPPPAPPAATSQ